MTDPPARHDRLARRRRDHLARLLAEAFAAVEDAVYRGMRERGFELEPVYHAVVRHVALEGSRISDIAARAGLAKQTVGPLVRELARRGIVRVDPDPADRRAKVVRFTSRGLAGLEAGLAVVKAVEQHCARTLGAGGLDRLKADLRTIRETAHITEASR